MTEGGILWTCGVCGTENPLTQESCSVCGASFAETVRPKAADRPPRDPGTAALLSLALPGAGHWYLGMKGQAVARAIISIWVVFVVIVSGIQRGVPGSLAIAFAFGLAAFALWFVSAHDAYREARSEPGQVLLKGKIFVYVVLGLLFLLIALMIPAALRAGR